MLVTAVSVLNDSLCETLRRRWQPLRASMIHQRHIRVKILQLHHLFRNRDTLSQAQVLA
jgi:hypothetical protein